MAARAVERIVERHDISARLADTSRFSSNSTCGEPAPRFSDALERAASISTWRISREDIAKKCARSRHDTPRRSINSDINLVDESRRLKGLARTLLRHLPVRPAMQFAVDERRQLLERLLVAIAPGAQELGDLLRIRNVSRRLFVVSRPMGPRSSSRQASRFSAGSTHFSPTRLPLTPAISAYGDRDAG